MEDISEAVSEKPAKRGRPTKIGPDWNSYLKTNFPEIKTTRGRQNKDCQLRAMGVLADDPAFSWLFGGTSKEVLAGTNAAPLRATILAELGRFEDDEELRQAAVRICELKPGSKNAVALLRRWRTGKSPQPDCLALTSAIVKTINSYLSTKPATTWQQVLAALDNARDMVEESAKD